MSKIICDVCGTSYPETALQCPICGCVRPGDVRIVTGDTEIQPEERPAGTYTHVKGGRFSKSNVRRRNAGNADAASAKQETPPEKPVEDSEDALEKPRKNQNLGLTIAVVALLLAIIAVALYMVLRFFAPSFINGDETKGTKPIETTQTQPSTQETTTAPTETTEETVGDVVVAFHVDEEIVLTTAGETFTLAVSGAEGDVAFESADEAVATVDEKGVVTAVAAGETKIIVTCGEQTAECNVICQIEEEETTAPVENVELKLNREDFTMSYKGDTWDLYDGELDAALIIWTSSRPHVATVDAGVVKAVSYSKDPVTITAEYNGVKATCLVRCNGDGKW